MGVDFRGHNKGGGGELDVEVREVQFGTGFGSSLSSEEVVLESLQISSGEGETVGEAGEYNLFGGHSKRSISTIGFDSGDSGEVDNVVCRIFRERIELSRVVFRLSLVEGIIFTANGDVKGLFPSLANYLPTEKVSSQPLAVP